jgi:hypothetical protein
MGAKPISTDIWRSLISAIPTRIKADFDDIVRMDGALAGIIATRISYRSAAGARAA